MGCIGPVGPVERQLGWVVSLIGVVQLVLYTVPAFRASSGHPQWWNYTGITLAGLILLLAVFGRVLPVRLLLRLWLAIPLALGLLAATAFSPAWGAPGDLSPWPWTMDWTAYAYLALAVRRPALAFVGPLAIGTLPGASALLFLGEIPHDLAIQIPLRVSGIGFTVLFLALRLRLRALHDSESRARETEERRVRSLAEAERRQKLALLVHDHVLSVLNAAMLLGTAQPDALRAGAGAALDLLESPPERSIDGEGERVAELARRWQTAWLRLDPECEVSFRADGGAHIPLYVASALEEASLEALRNSLRHAGAGATRAITARLGDDGAEILVRDTGRGFDPDAVPTERMGMRGSVLGRVRGVGGAAAVASSPTTGTEVRISWQQR